MGHEKNVKLLRGQIRQIVQELMPDVLSKELVSTIYGKLDKTLSDRTEFMAEQIDARLEAIDERAKDIQDYVVRNSAASVKAPPAVETPATGDTN